MTLSGSNSRLPPFLPCPPEAGTPRKAKGMADSKLMHKDGALPMTTIAWDGRFVAADSQCVAGGYAKPETARKIRRIGDLVYAVSGLYCMFDAMIEWHRQGADPREVPACKSDGDDIVLIVFYPSGRCWSYRSSVPYPDEAFAPDAWGSGYQFAIGAMKARCNAETAVSIAAKCDVGTGGDIFVEELASNGEKGWGVVEAN